MSKDPRLAILVTDSKFLIIRVTVRSCIPAGQRSLRLPQLCGEDGFSTRAADGRHSGAVSPVYTKIGKILVIVHNVRGTWTIGAASNTFTLVASDRDGGPLKVWKGVYLYCDSIAATKLLPTTLPFGRLNSFLWSDSFLSGKKAFFAL